MALRLVLLVAACATALASDSASSACVAGRAECDAQCGTLSASYACTETAEGLFQSCACAGASSTDASSAKGSASLYDLLSSIFSSSERGAPSVSSASASAVSSSAAVSSSSSAPRRAGSSDAYVRIVAIPMELALELMSSTQNVVIRTSEWLSSSSSSSSSSDGKASEGSDEHHHHSKHHEEGEEHHRHHEHDDHRMHHDLDDDDDEPCALGPVTVLLLLGGMGYLAVRLGRRMGRLSRERAVLREPQTLTVVDLSEPLIVIERKPSTFAKV